MVCGVLQGLQNDVLHTVCSWYDGSLLLNALTVLKVGTAYKY